MWRHRRSPLVPVHGVCRLRAGRGATRCVCPRAAPRPAWGQFRKCHSKRDGNLYLRLVAVPESNPPSIWPCHAHAADLTGFRALSMDYSPQMPLAPPIRSGLLRAAFLPFPSRQPDAQRPPPWGRPRSPVPLSATEFSLSFQPPAATRFQPLFLRMLFLSPERKLLCLTARNPHHLSNSPPTARTPPAPLAPAPPKVNRAHPRIPASTASAPPTSPLCAWKTSRTSPTSAPTSSPFISPSTLRKSSHYAPDFETVTVYYPWHPRVGQSLPVRFRKKVLQDELVSCQLPDKTTLSIPTWMLHPDAARFTLGPPQIAVGALVELRELLWALRAPSGGDPSPLGKEAAAEASNQVTESGGSRPPKRSATRNNGAPPLPPARAPKG